MCSITLKDPHHGCPLSHCRNILLGNSKQQPLGLRAWAEIPEAAGLQRLPLPERLGVLLRGHGMFPEVMRELQSPKKQWKKYLGWTYGLVVPVHAVCAYLGYYAYGDSAQANTNLNFPDNSMNRLLIIMQLCLCYYLAYFTNLVLLIQVEGALGVGLGVRGSRVAARRLLILAAFLGSQIALGKLLLVKKAMSSSVCGPSPAPSE